MRKKFFATLVAVFMMIGMTGCGDTAARSGSTEPTSEDRLTEVQTEESGGESKTDVAAESKGGNTEGGEESSMAEETSTISSSTESTEASIAVDENKPTMTACVRYNAGNGADYTLFSVEPDTQSYTEISSFSYRSTDEGYYDDALRIYYQNYSDMFSQDLSKMAVTYVVRAPKYACAGWIDDTGAFFNVPAALGMEAENEFVAQPNYYSVGFTNDGKYFVFVECTDDHFVDPAYERPYYFEDHGKFYYVALDDLSVAYEGNPLDEEAKNGYDEVIQITDWVDNNRYLSELDQNCIIRSADEPANYTELIPGETRINRSAIVGPDGNIAFVSNSKGSYEDMAIYSISLESSNPQKVFDCNLLSSKIGRTLDAAIRVYLLRWE